MTRETATAPPAAYEALRTAGGAVRRGEWTTYGEISMLVFGHRGASRAVGRWLAQDETFANAHRVLRAGGRVAPGWGGGGDGPARCRSRLQAEGVEFSGDTAPARCRVTWSVLAERLGPGPRRHTAQ